MLLSINIFKNFPLLIKEMEKKDLNNMLTSKVFVFNLGMLYDVLNELSDLSLQLQKRDLGLAKAHNKIDRGAERSGLSEGRSSINCGAVRSIYMYNQFYQLLSTFITFIR
ncbi:unnamed protein product [Macrosiphum euphorbiae]|uniref:Uncharacterized protein n=1 Tax=Macrosiphum euphorbiae TaxID=13131 RepID=A0AAV0XUB0_9HEMI|nr:unnamed protein product [Macrosiphum euphorbiae]